MADQAQQDVFSNPELIGIILHYTLPVQLQAETTRAAKVPEHILIALFDTPATLAAYGTTLRAVCKTWREHAPEAGRCCWSSKRARASQSASRHASANGVIK